MKKYNKLIVIIVGTLLLLAVLIEIIFLVILAHQGSRYGKYWKARASVSYQADELLYVALGDSVGVGIGASSPNKGYVGLIAESLEQKTGQPVRVVNLSKSGAKINDGIEKQLPALKAYQPDVVTVGLGSNDLAQGWDEDVFRSDMKKLVDGLPANTVVAEIPYFGGGIKRGVEENVPRANKIIHELTNRKKLSTARLHETTKANDNLFIYAADYFHPNNRGHHNWHKAFWSELSRRVY